MHRRFVPVAVAVALAAAFVPVAGHAAAWTARPATYKAFVLADQKITMSDGVRLNADIVFPSLDGASPAPGRFPAILTQTPYNKNATSLNFRSDYLVTRGYVQVIADVRGTGGSEGSWDSFGTREQIDGANLVDWITMQPWYDAATGVGGHGTSYGAINQILTAAQQPAALKALFPIVPMADSYRDIAVTGGEADISFIPLWLGLVTSLGILPPTYTPSHPDEAATVLAGHAANVAQFQGPAVARATLGDDQAYDGPFYRTRSPIEVIDKVRVPTFIVGGWFDLFQRGEPMLFNRLQANGVDAKLLMGPWYHTTAGSAARLGAWTADELELRWMDHYVRNVADATLDTDIPPVTYTPETGPQTQAASWPPAGVRYQPAYLDGSASTGAPGTLSTTAPGTGSDTLLAQPASGTCTRSTSQWTAGGTNLVAPGPCDTDQHANDATGLSYDYAVPSDLTLAGPMSLHLFASTNAHDLFLTVRVEDVAADGSASQISAGWNQWSMAQDLDPRTVVDPASGLVVQPFHAFTRAAQAATDSGEHEVWLEIFPAATTIAKGHSLRVSIQPSDAPHEGASLPQTASSAGSALTVYHDAEHPSALVLPVR